MAGSLRMPGSQGLRDADLLRLGAAVATAAFLIDWASKSWALRALDGSGTQLFWLVLNVERNDGLAFSTASGLLSPWLIAGLRVAALVVLLLVARRVVARSFRYACGTALLLGGGFGNAADMIFRDGAVVDFIGAGPIVLERAGWPVQVHFVFNIADVAIVAGLVLLAPRIRMGARYVQRRLERIGGRVWSRLGAWVRGDGRASAGRSAR
jgi:lipoprotein signal peptidase